MIGNACQETVFWHGLCRCSTNAPCRALWNEDSEEVIWVKIEAIQSLYHIQYGEKIYVNFDNRSSFGQM